MMKALVANAKTAPALAIIRSLGRRGIEITGASDISSDFPLFSKFCKKKILLRTDSDDMGNKIKELLNIFKNNHFDVFFPLMREDSLLALAKYKNDFEQYTRIVLPSLDQLSILSDKAKVSSLLSELGIPGPKTYFVNSESVLDSILENANFPLIIKPFRGEGTTGIKIIYNPKELEINYNKIESTYGSTLIQEFIYGKKYSAVFLLNKNYEVRRFFVHHAIREYPINGGPACFLESVKYDPIYEYGLKLLTRANYSGMAEMEFIVDNKDGKPKIIDVNPRFYGSLQCAIAAGVDFPFDVFNMAMKGDIETDLSYKEGVTCRHLLFEDTKHLLSVLRGEKSPKYSIGKMATILNYLNFFHDDSYFVLSLSDPLPALKKIIKHL
jgi:predicted ATP-grasp superfamily ATP-dependent carboligase